MGIVQREEKKKMEMDKELKRMVVACGSLNRRRKDDQGLSGTVSSKQVELDDLGENKLVCVTSGVSFLGLAVVNRLLTRGYSVRVVVDNEEDKEKLRDVETWSEGEGEGGEIISTLMGCGKRTGRGSSYNDNNYRMRVEAVVAKMSEVESLAEAFQGCRGVFHTSAFTDPAGLSGYTKSMGEIEVKGTENVIEACSRTSSVRNCVFTSSLLACLWPDLTAHDPQVLPRVISHDSWSDESVCNHKKLWYALGKLRAEKAAWERTREKGLRLATICPGLITGPKFFDRNPTATFAYLKGADEMFGNGLLATADVIKVAEAHTHVFEAMHKTAANGRYICFDGVVETEEEAEKLAREIGISASKILQRGSINAPSISAPPKFKLSNKKLCGLMSRTVLDTCFSHS